VIRAPEFASVSCYLSIAVYCPRNCAGFNSFLRPFDFTQGLQPSRTVNSGSTLSKAERVETQNSELETAKAQPLPQPEPDSLHHHESHPIDHDSNSSARLFA
jgi:hypothetical protein